MSDASAVDQRRRDERDPDVGRRAPVELREQ
jgi:hypothetical protein